MPQVLLQQQAHVALMQQPSHPAKPADSPAQHLTRTRGPGDHNVMLLPINGGLQVPAHVPLYTRSATQAVAPSPSQQSLSGPGADPTTRGFPTAAATPAGTSLPGPAVQLLQPGTATWPHV